MLQNMCPSLLSHVAFSFPFSFHNYLQFVHILPVNSFIQVFLHWLSSFSSLIFYLYIFFLSLIRFFLHVLSWCSFFISFQYFFSLSFLFSFSFVRLHFLFPYLYLRLNSFHFLFFPLCSFFVFSCFLRVFPLCFFTFTFIVFLIFILQFCSFCLSRRCHFSLHFFNNCFYLSYHFLCKGRLWRPHRLRDRRRRSLPVRRHVLRRQRVRKARVARRLDRAPLLHRLDRRQDRSPAQALVEFYHVSSKLISRVVYNGLDKIHQQYRSGKGHRHPKYKFQST